VEVQLYTLLNLTLQTGEVCFRPASFITGIFFNLDAVGKKYLCPVPGNQAPLYQSLRPQSNPGPLNLQLESIISVRLPTKIFRIRKRILTLTQAMPKQNVETVFKIYYAV